MVEIGSRITARVVRIDSYGLWLKHDADDVLVMAPDISWKAGAPTNLARVGDELELLVVRYNYPKRVVVGSLKALHPEENPYRHLARMEPGEMLVGTVATAFADDIRVDLPHGVWGNIPRRRVSEELRPGDVVAVRIFALEVDEGRLTLDFVRKMPAGSELVPHHVPSRPAEPVS